MAPSSSPCHQDNGVVSPGSREVEGGGVGGAKIMPKNCLTICRNLQEKNPKFFCVIIVLDFSAPSPLKKKDEKTVTKLRALFLNPHRIMAPPLSLCH